MGVFRKKKGYMVPRGRLEPVLYYIDNIYYYIFFIIYCYI